MVLADLDVGGGPVRHAGLHEERAVRGHEVHHPHEDLHAQDEVDQARHRQVERESGVKGQFLLED